MSRYTRCPNCGNEASGGFGGVYIRLHKCRDKNHVFCERCINGDRCPIPGCGSSNISKNFDKAYTKK